MTSSRRFTTSGRLIRGHLREPRAAIYPRYLGGVRRERETQPFHLGTEGVSAPKPTRKEWDSALPRSRTAAKASSVQRNSRQLEDFDLFLKNRGLLGSSPDLAEIMLGSGHPSGLSPHA